METLDLNKCAACNAAPALVAEIERLQAGVDGMAQEIANRAADNEKLREENERLKADNAMLRKEMGYYANPDNWGDIHYQTKTTFDRTNYLHGSCGWARAERALKGGE